ncbi:PadR family transcriptional regulator [Arthrobacter alpinus]|nr:PadR family transcriptional regulator [Arthrobacter alpinus]
MKKLECIVLGRLATNPMSGYDLYKWMSKEAPYFGYSPKPPQIYRQLNDFLTKGWVGVTVDQRGSGPDAKVYTLTPAGVAAFLDWAMSEHSPTIRPLEADFQMRMLLGGVIGPQAAMDVLTTELKYRRRQQAESRPYEAPADLGEAAVPVDADWQAELVRMVGNAHSCWANQTSLGWRWHMHAWLPTSRTTALSTHNARTRRMNNADNLR